MSDISATSSHVALPGSLLLPAPHLAGNLLLCLPAQLQERVYDKVFEGVSYRPDKQANTLKCAKYPELALLFTCSKVRANAIPCFARKAKWVLDTEPERDLLHEGDYNKLVELWGKKVLNTVTDVEVLWDRGKIFSSHPADWLPRDWTYGVPDPDWTRDIFMAKRSLEHFGQAAIFLKDHLPGVEKLRLTGDFSVDGSDYGGTLFESNAMVVLFLRPLTYHVPRLAFFEVNEHWRVDANHEKQGFFDEWEYLEMKHLWEARGVEVSRSAAEHEPLQRPLPRFLRQHLGQPPQVVFLSGPFFQSEDDETTGPGGEAEEDAGTPNDGDPDDDGPNGEDSEASTEAYAEKDKDKDMASDNDEAMEDANDEEDGASTDEQDEVEMNALDKMMFEAGRGGWY